MNLKITAFVAALAVAATPALAGFTTINTGSASESSANDILNNLLGTSFTLGDLNAGASGLRVDDDFDHFLSDGTQAARFTAIYWGGADSSPGTAAHKFGYNLTNPVVPASNVELFDTSAISPGDTISYGTPIGTEIRFWAQNKSNGNIRYMDPAANGGTDYVATFDLTGLEGAMDFSEYGGTNNLMTGSNVRTYALFFDTGSDQDRQDLVVLVQFVPAPAAFGLGMLGLGLVGWMKRRLA
jgi:hypothetical protein